MDNRLKNDKEDAIKVLEYWFLTELLNQESLNVFKEKGIKASGYKKELREGKREKSKKVVEDFVQLKEGENLQSLIDTQPKQLINFKHSDFTVFIGCMKKDKCIDEIAKNVQWSCDNPDAKATSDEEIPLAIIKFSKNGKFMLNSLTISPLVWAMMKISQDTDNISQNLSIDKYKLDTKNIKNEIIEFFKSSEFDELVSDETNTSSLLNMVSYGLLITVEKIIVQDLRIKYEDMSSILAVYFKLYDSNDESAGETNVSLHMDFYSKDLSFVIDGLQNNMFTEEKEKMLLDYILGIKRYTYDLEQSPKRFDIIKPINKDALYRFMIDKLNIKNAPLGKWPSRFMPALMQQIAVNLAISQDTKLPIFSVNGPPGTGKTTLLKEIIVNNIIEKAIILAEYDKPDDAFDDFTFMHGDGPNNSYNRYYSNYHRLKNKKINEFSILVTSSNNTAVENITKELPVEESLLGNIKPSLEVNAPNENALAELTRLFTVSESTEKISVKKEDGKGKAKKICFEELPDIYFSKLATDLLNADVDDEKQKKVQAVGLISASLGKKDNIVKVEENVIAPLLHIIGKNSKIDSRKNYYNEIRGKFLEQLELVKKLRKDLDVLLDREKSVYDAHSAVVEIEKQIDEWRNEQDSLNTNPKFSTNELQRDIEQLKNKHEKCLHEIETLKSLYDMWEDKIKREDTNIEIKLERIKALNKRVSIFDKLFKSQNFKKLQKKFDLEYEEISHCQQRISGFTMKLEEENNKLCSQKDKLNGLEKEISELSKELKKIELIKEECESKGKRLELSRVTAIKKEEEQQILLEEELGKYNNKDSYERGFVLDYQFIDDVLSTDQDVSTKAQLRNPWFSEQYNREREKLFYYALQMTKVFILYSHKCRNNFKHLHCLWGGSYIDDGNKVKFIDDDLQKCTSAAYETLFLLIPVISSTFASVQRLFENVKEQDFIGTLIVDEAGQATPHMIIGALSRSNKTVIVGDPKQVEPVVTDNQDLLKQIYTDDLYKPYKDKTNSVQRFADIINPYGTYLKNAQGDEEWVGCPLLVHRRCISPMYEISNDISYNNIMKQQTSQPSNAKQQLFLTEQSQWFNIRGKEEGKKRHFVKEQGEKVIEMLEVAFSKKSPPDLFIISPFKTVESGIIDFVKKYVKCCKNDGVQSPLVENEKELKTWLSRNVGTVHKFQGREASEVILLLGCDTSEDAKPAIKWVNNNIVNVAATRAKYRFYIIGDIEAWKNSRCVKRAKKILDSYTAGNLDYMRKGQNFDGNYILVITEKPSVAEAYATALCAWNEPTSDFYEGNGYLITWCLGHLMELAPPEAYNSKYKNWDIHDLPIIPNVWKYQIRRSKDLKEGENLKHRFDVIKNLMNRDDVSDIFCATDAGREGELIFRLVYQETKCKKPFKRIWLSSMEPKTIRKAFETPRPSAEYDSLYDAARCRQLADWIVGLNATRYFSVSHEEKGKTMSIGRVVSPTMSMIVEREKEIESFVPKTYYTVKLNVGGVIFESRQFETEEEASHVVKKVKSK